MKKSQLKVLLEKTPRRLGVLNQIRLVAAGPGSVSWIIFCLLILLCIGMGIKDTFLGLTAFRNLETTRGTIAYADWTGWTFNDYDQVVIEFRFEANGNTYSGISYAIGVSPKKGDQIDIEYVRGNPNLARAKGYDYQKLTFLVLVPFGLALLFGLAGLFGWRSTLRWARLLEHGELMEANLVSREKTGASINEHPVQKLTFAFTDQRGETHQLEISTHLVRKFTDEPVELGLYDPKNPEWCHLIDQMPFKMTISQPGYWDPPSNKVSLIIRLIFFMGAWGWLIARCITLFR